ncbi:MAG: biotin--[acetyl-CoA-carboxylase] ligase [Gammaproteobacteria bacterium]|nr:biotin--[acetyl-CoA-carboxylase] ligase [Gammaproteobacteria bacterium]
MPKNIKALLKILCDGKYHSGTTLGAKLKVTRGAIWKSIKQLKEYGINIEAKTNLGYRIPGGLELLDKKNITKHIAIKHKFDANEILIFDELPSTNNYLADLIKEKKLENCERYNSDSGKLGVRKNKKTLKPKSERYFCFAEYQTAARGRFGRNWICTFAQNIYLSLSWQFSREPHELSGLGLVIAVAVAESLKSYGIKNGISLKWPNDVLWENRKLVGILIDLFGEIPHIYNAIIGIGINLNISQEKGDQITQPWCDIAQITGLTPKRNQLAGLLLDNLLEAISTYQDQGLKPFIKKWLKLDAAYGKKVTVITNEQNITGTGMGIDDKGYFLLKDNHGKTRSFASAEVSLRIQP